MAGTGLRCQLQGCSLLLRALNFNPVHNPLLVPQQISTVNMGLAIGWSCVVLSFGKKGLRKSLPHSLGERH